MKLSHYSNEPTLIPHPVDQSDDPDWKPRGLWVSVDGHDDWPTWCKSEDFGDIDSQYRHSVTLADKPLILSTADEILRFSGAYGTEPREWANGTSWRVDYIRWNEVAADYPGIIIAPYQWPLRLDRRTRWYYPWDCASGCIWDVSIIKSVQLMQEAAS